MLPAPAALVIAHPGHELRLHHWLEVAHPRVFVLTDGSGSGGSRIHSTIEILRTNGCAAGSILGAFTDREIYRALLDGDVDRTVAMTLQLADDLLEHGIRSVVTDAFETYNPTHDLASVVTRLAAERAGLARVYEYAVTEIPFSDGETLELDDAALSRKIAAAQGCAELQLEVRSLIERIGLDALRREVFRPIATAIALPGLPSKPFYETHGEQRVAAGQYGTVIRYEEHFRPFVETLRAAVKAMPLLAWRS